MSDSLLPRGLQHARPACPSPTPAACSNSCPLSRWCCPTVSPSVVPFSSRPHRCLRWWWTGRPGGLQSTGHKRVGRNWATEQRQTFLIFSQIFRYEWLNKKCLSFCKDFFQFKFFSISDYIIKRFFFSNSFLFFFNHLLSPSLVCSPHERPVNPRVEVLRQGRGFNWGTSRPRRPLASSSE